MNLKNALWEMGDWRFKIDSLTFIYNNTLNQQGIQNIVDRSKLLGCPVFTDKNSYVYLINNGTVNFVYNDALNLNVAMNNMFFCFNHLELLDLTGLGNLNVTDLSYMFYGCTKLQQLDISNFSTTNDPDTAYMFKGCNALTTIQTNDKQILEAFRNKSKQHK